MENIYTVDTYVDIFKSCRNNPFPFNVINGSNLVRNWKSTIDLHTRRLPSPRKQFLSIKETIVCIWSKKKKF